MKHVDVVVTTNTYIWVRKIMSFVSSSTSWSIEAWCAIQPAPVDQISLPASTQYFLRLLNLSEIHPFCDPSSAPDPYYMDDILPRQGPLLQHDHLENWNDVVMSMYSMFVPPLLAMMELWLRLLASILAPMGIAHLLYNEITSVYQKTMVGSRWMYSAICILTVVASAILLTDTLYVIEYGHQYNGAVWIVAVLLSLQTCRRYQLKTAALVIVLLLSITAKLLYNPETHSIAFGDIRDQLDLPEGLYYDKTNIRAKQIVQHWPDTMRTYSTETGATAWMPTGDARTGLPFLLNHEPTSPNWHRLWLPLPDNEVVALDILFPKNGHSPHHPLYMILHGLNGGSQEQYVVDFANRQVAVGSTVVVMVARGLMDLPIRGGELFHGARWRDPWAAAKALRKATSKEQILAGVGYSMGAIILANMVARTGTECPLDVAVSISGGLDMRYEIDFHRAQRLWQPLLCRTLRDKFILGKWGERVRQRLTKDEMKALMRATHVTEIDKTAIVAYYGYDDVQHYYAEMSVLGDVTDEDEYLAERLQPTRRIHNISIPLLIVHAADDPLVTWRTVASNTGLRHPFNLTSKTGSGNLLILLTQRGGHVGWPTGLLSFVEKWKWMSGVSTSFVEAVAQAKTLE